MKLVSFVKNGNECAGLISGDQVYRYLYVASGFSGHDE